MNIPGFTKVAGVAWGWSFLTSKFGGPIAAGVAFLAAAGLMFFVGQNALLKGQLKVEKGAHQTAVRNLNQCKSNGLQLEGALDAQSDAVKAMKAEGDRRTAEAEKALSEARAKAETYRKKVVRLQAAVPGVDACASARDLIVMSLTEDRP